jgi:hypothetical protein
LPAGISFYTFTTLCYTIDMYKKESAPVKSLLDFSLFVTFFPHLVAGPIVRPPQLVPQFEHPRSATQKQLLDGLLLLSLGLFMKVVLADALLADTADAVLTRPMHYHRSMPGQAFLLSQDRFSWTLPVILPVRSVWRCALVLCCHRISIIRTPQSVFLISGKDGTLRCRPGCVTICTFRLAVIKTDA